MLAESILLKKFLRNDALWTNFVAFNSFLRHIPFILDTQILMRSQFWSRERLDALTKIQLENTFKRAQKLPFWHERFQRVGFDTQKDVSTYMQRLPILTKKDFAASKESEYTDQELLGTSEYDHTSGSTAAPFRFFRSRGLKLSAYAFSERAIRTAGGGKRFHVIVLLGSDRTGVAFTNYDFLFLRGYNSVRYRIDDLFEFMARHPNGVLFWGIRSVILEVARAVKDRKIPVPIQGAIAGGEMMSEEHREEIEQGLRTKVWRHYATGELSKIAFECPQRNLHINEERLYIEILDETDKPVSRGTEGRVVITVFDNTVMPYIRYDLGDRAIIPEKPCSCGRTLRTIKLLGRKPALTTFENGRTVSFLDVAAVFSKHPEAIRQFRIVRTGNLDLSILVVPGPRFELKKEYFTESMRRIVHPLITVTWKVLEAIPEGPGGKAVYFQDDYAKKSTPHGNPA